MCYGSLPSKADLFPTVPRQSPPDAAAVFYLQNRLAETEARLARARAREAELSRKLEEMKKFVSVMEILETYLKRCFRQQQTDALRLLSPVSS